jgi:hypothetical protein
MLLLLMLLLREGRASDVKLPFVATAQFSSPFMRDASMTKDWLPVVPFIGLQLSPPGPAEPSAVDCLRIRSRSLLNAHCLCSASLRHSSQKRTGDTDTDTDIHIVSSTATPSQVHFLPSQILEIKCSRTRSTWQAGTPFGWPASSSYQQ